MSKHSSTIARIIASRLLFITTTATPELYTLSLHDALPISPTTTRAEAAQESATHLLDSSQAVAHARRAALASRSEEHTSELQSLRQLVCRLLLEKKKDVC